MFVVHPSTWKKYIKDTHTHVNILMVLPCEGEKLAHSTLQNFQLIGIPHLIPKSWLIVVLEAPCSSTYLLVATVQSSNGAHCNHCLRFCIKIIKLWLCAHFCNVILHDTSFCTMPMFLHNRRHQISNDLLTPKISRIWLLGF